MRKLIVLALLGTSSAFAGESVKISPINCDALNGDTRVCVENETHVTITGISCAGHIYGRSEITLPRGRIPSGGIAIVNFNTGACDSSIFVKTSDGKEHEIQHQNIANLTVLPIVEGDDNW